MRGASQKKTACDRESLMSDYGGNQRDRAGLL